jgi:hypothetical protein
MEDPRPAIPGSGMGAHDVAGQVSRLAAAVPTAFPGDCPVASWWGLTAHGGGTVPDSHRLPSKGPTPGPGPARRQVIRPHGGSAVNAGGAPAGLGYPALLRSAPRRCVYSWAESQRSASIAAAHPDPAAVTAWR